MLRTALTCCALVLALSAGGAYAGPDDMRRAAERGDPEMQLELGILYEYGYGLKENHVPALAWYTLSAEQGNARAIQHRDTLKARMSANEVAAATRQAELLRAVIAEQRAKAAPVPVQAPAPDAQSAPVPVSTPVPPPADDAASAPATDRPATLPVSVPVASEPSPAPTAPAESMSDHPASGPVAPTTEAKPDKSATGGPSGSQAAATP